MLFVCLSLACRIADFVQSRALNPQLIGNPDSHKYNITLHGIIRNLHPFQAATSFLGWGRDGGTDVAIGKFFGLGFAEAFDMLSHI